MRIALAAALLLACKAPTNDPDPGSGSATAALPDAGAKPSKKPPAATTSPLPEKGPHPDYPTPVGAGTDKLFVIEEPDRGPQAPIDFPLPTSASLTWTAQSYCEPDAATVTCSDKPHRSDALVRWRIGREGTMTVAEKRRGTAVEETYVYVADKGSTTKRIVFDSHGRVSSALLFSSPTRYSKRLRTGANGLAGCGSMDLVVDKQGRTDAAKCLQWSGDPMRDTDGVASRRYMRDARGFVVEETRLGVDGNPVAATDGIHRIRYELDGDGRVSVERYLGIDSSPVSNIKGCHGTKIEYDERGLVKRRSCIGADNKPSNDSRGSATQELSYDALGCQVGNRYTAIGIAPRDPGIDYVVDTHCAVLSHTCVGTTGNRVVCSAGDPARYDYKRDTAGNAISTMNYKPDGTPDRDPVWHGFEIRREFDLRGNATSIACFNQRDQRATCENLGFWKQLSEYDGVGREVTRRFLDVDDRPAMNTGATVRKFIYDNYDHLFEGRGYDNDGNLIQALGMSVRRDLFDAAHRRFGVILLDKSGQPARYTGCYGGATCPKEWHAVRLVRHADGTIDKNEFFDVAGQLIDTKDCTKVRCFR